MAKRGDPEALDVMRGQLRPGPYAADLAWRLADIAGEAPTQDLVELILTRFEQADLEELVDDERTSLPWDQWAETYERVNSAVKRPDRPAGRGAGLRQQHRRR